MITTKNKQVAEPVPPEVKQMSPATREWYFKIQSLYESATDNELQRRYEIGDIVKVLTADEGKYGQNVLLPVSAALGIGVDYLYRSQKLASTWTWGEIETLRNRVNRFGRRVEFTHLWLIANVSQSKTRELLIEEFVRDGLTTRDLEKRIKKLIAKSSSSQMRRPKSPSAGLASMRKTAADYGEKCAVWQETVFEPIKDIASNGVEIECFDDLVATKRSHEELKQQVEHTIEKIDECIRFAEAARDRVRKAKRHPKTTTPSRPRATGKPTKTKVTVGRRRVVV